MNAPVAGSVQMRNLFPQFSAFCFNLRTDAELHLPIPARFHSAIELNHQLSLPIFQPQEGQDCLRNNGCLRVCALPQVNTFMSRILRLVFVQRSSESFVQKRRYDSFRADVSHFRNVVRWAVGILLPDYPCRAANCYESIGVYSPREIGIESLVFHSSPIVPKGGVEWKQWGEWGPTAEHGFGDQRPLETCTFSNGDGTGVEVTHVGKKAAGRLLDGREWSEFPVAQEVKG